MKQLTKLQTIRKTLMNQLQKIEEGKADTEEINVILGISDSVTKTYNTELRAKELELNAENKHIKLGDLDVFEKMQ
jgi:hypothetical protein